MKLTVKNVRALQLPEGKSDHLVWDDEIPGLGLRLRADGSRVFVFQYALGAKQRRLSLGAATAESFATVKAGDGAIIKLGIRDQAAQLHAKVRLGQDPAGDKTESRKRASDGRAHQERTRQRITALDATRRATNDVHRHERHAGRSAARC